MQKSMIQWEAISSKKTHAERGVGDEGELSKVSVEVYDCPNMQMSLLHKWGTYAECVSRRGAAYR